MKVRPTPIVLLLCGLSLVEWEPVSVAEQSLAPVLAVGEGLVARLSATPAALDDEARRDLADAAQVAWDAYRESLRAWPHVTDPADDSLVVPVLALDEARRELVIRVPPGTVALDTPVTHRGVLLGFLRTWDRTGAVDGDGRARVALLGHSLARSVAGEWKGGEGAAAVHFLVGRGEHAPELSHRSHDFAPAPGQIAWTRDVHALGDPLPAGLLLGTVVSRGEDQPGGGAPVRPAGFDGLQPLLDPRHVGHVTVQVAAGASLPERRVTAALVGSCGAVDADRLRIDRGRIHGVGTGDLVAEGATLVGVVVVAGPASSVVSRHAWPGLLLVPNESGELIPVTRDAESWPDGWKPAAGRPVFSGHRDLGGLECGVVGAVGPSRWRLAPSPFDEAAPLTVVPR